MATLLHRARIKVSNYIKIFATSTVRDKHSLNNLIVWSIQEFTVNISKKGYFFQTSIALKFLHNEFSLRRVMICPDINFNHVRIVSQYSVCKRESRFVKTSEYAGAIVEDLLFQRRVCFSCFVQLRNYYLVASVKCITPRRKWRQRPPVKRGRPRRTLVFH